MNKPLSSLVANGVGLGEKVLLQVYRARPDGYAPRPDIECYGDDLIVTTGLNYIAIRIGHGDTIASAMAYMAVGTVTTAATYTDTTLTGEVKRKALSTASATGNLWNGVTTLGGFADTVTSLQMTEAGILNHASSGQGTLYQRVTFSQVTLADSDLLKLTLQTNVGSR